MKTRLLLFLLLGCLFANAQNIEVNGFQSGIWEADTVFVTGDVIVQDLLDIKAGTTVIFNGFYGTASKMEPRSTPSERKTTPFFLL